MSRGRSALAGGHDHRGSVGASRPGRERKRARLLLRYAPSLPYDLCVENSDPIEHVPVLVQPVLELLSPRPGEVLLDCTLGHAGHAAVLAPQIGPTGRKLLPLSVV